MNREQSCVMLRKAVSGQCSKINGLGMCWIAGCEPLKYLYIVRMAASVVSLLLRLRGLRAISFSRVCF